MHRMYENSIHSLLKEYFMKTAVIPLIFLVMLSSGVSADEGASAAYAGSGSCRECHERFYGLWSTSFHGLAMQPYSDNLAKNKLTLPSADIIIGKQRYRAEVGP